MFVCAHPPEHLGKGEVKKLVLYFKVLREYLFNPLEHPVGNCQKGVLGTRGFNC